MADGHEPLSTPPDTLELRDRLLCAAVLVFDRKGYAAASVREIAEAVGVTKPTVYYHFGSKEGLLVAILTEAQREFAAVVAAGVARPGTAQQRILALCDDIYRLFEHNVPMARVAHAIMFGPPEAVPAFDLAVFEAGFVAAIERIVADGQAAGEFRDVAPREVALAIGGILQGCYERQLHPSLKPVGPDVLGRLLGLLFEGISGPHAPRERIRQ